MRKGALHVLQAESAEVLDFLLLNYELVHGLGADLGDRTRREDGLHVVEVAPFVEQRQRAHVLNCGMRNENVVDFLGDCLHATDCRRHI